MRGHFIFWNHSSTEFENRTVLIYFPIFANKIMLWLNNKMYECIAKKFISEKLEKCLKYSLHRPGIEPGPPAWQASILPLNQRCLYVSVVKKSDLLHVFLRFSLWCNIKSKAQKLFFLFRGNQFRSNHHWRNLLYHNGRYWRPAKNWALTILFI